MNAPDTLPVNRKRRALLVASLATGGGLLIGGLPATAATTTSGEAGGWQPNPYLRIDPDGRIVVFAPYCEMGQGSYTSQAMVVAEELDVPLARVAIEAAPADDATYASPLLGGQITGGSASLRAQWTTMRNAGAAARAMLVQAAASQWGVAPGDCATADGAVTHAASKRSLPAYQKDHIDLDVVENAVGHYDIPNVWIDFTRHEAPEGMNTGNWRGVGPTRNVFITESVMDELAFRARADPLAYRRALMTQAPARLRHVLDVAAEKSGWGSPLPPRSGRGIAVFEGFACFMAIVAQVHVDADGHIAVERMTCALDTGTVVAPDVVLAQAEGGIMFGVSAALHERITVANGRVQQANYDSYPILRMAEAPRIEVHVVQNAEPPGGIGEPGTSGAIAAVANAVFAATGVRAYSLPLDPALFKVTT
ncbi:molybdopterin cofactor-binding domain-containing protein [Telluria beijingensis]|uniref:molybdopterin cofactor-binding domain-containing protein n=1 Tax=Telluria beijingensis TaxID=3068633 RepID=UPI002796079F|nr:molybdopterin cofactor-binding domain-containing protein [Massilia sp. REN29]